MPPANARSSARNWLALTACALLGLCAFAAPAQDFSVDWWTVDGGGELFSETADQQWQLSGTIGQWDSTQSLELSGGSWALSGGFWSLRLERPEQLFSDGFEG